MESAHSLNSRGQAAGASERTRGSKGVQCCGEWGLALGQRAQVASRKTPHARACCIPGQFLPKVCT